VACIAIRRILGIGLGLDHSGGRSIAAAVNDTSIVLGVAVGASGLTTFLTGAAIDTYLQQVPGATADSVGAFRQALDFVVDHGLPRRRSCDPASDGQD